MININKDKLAVALPVAFIVLLGVAMANIDMIFPSPSASEKISEIAKRVNFTAGNSSYGTSPDASVTVAVFSDFKCPACAMAVGELGSAMEYYGDEVNFVFKHFPAHEGSVEAAIAAECARDQGMFWEYHDMLFEKQHSLDVISLERYARIMLLDTEKFNECMLSGGKAAKVEADFREGVDAGIPGTPTFFVNGLMLVGVQPFEELKKAIDGELEKK